MESYQPNCKKAKYDFDDNGLEACFGLGLKDKTSNKWFYEVSEVLKRHFNSTFKNSILHIIQRCGKDDRELPIKYKAMKMKLILLLHSFMCNRKLCTVSKCSSMKETWLHIVRCENNTCTDSNCVSSRRLLQHWISCDVSQCVICFWCKKSQDLRKYNTGEQTGMFNNTPVLYNRKSRNIKG